MTTGTEQFAFDFDGQPEDDTGDRSDVRRYRGDVKTATVTVTEAARILGISRTTAYEAVRDGSLCSIRVRRRILIPRAWISDMLLGNTSAKMP